MENIQAMVAAMARLGNPEEANPVFETKRDRFSNTLGQGISNLYFETVRQSSIFRRLTMARGIQNQYEKLFGTSFKGSTELFPSRERREKYERNNMNVLEKFFPELESKDLKKIKALEEDKGLAIALIEKIRNGDRLACAAVWFPTVNYWCHQADGRIGRYTFDTVTELLVKYLDLERKLENAEISLDELRLWGQYGIAKYLPLDGRFFVDHNFGREFERERYGWAAIPNEKEVSEVPYQVRRQKWQSLQNQIKADSQEAIALIVRYNKIAESGAHRRLSEESAVQNLGLLKEFVAEAKSLPSMTEVADFARTNCVGYKERMRFTFYDVNKTFQLTENILTMASELPDQYSKHAIEVMDHLMYFLKNTYSLK